MPQETARPTEDLASARPVEGPAPQKQVPQVNREYESRWNRKWFVRLIALIVVACPVGALVVASQLRPDSRGLGTHQQLGLPPCSMRVMFGIRCPGCGMTTSWAYFTRGEFRSSAATNFAGFLLAWYALMIAGLASRSVISGSVPSYRNQQIATITGFSIGIIALINWAIVLVM
ncbi:MAG: DUF2752 domain-containing protein [Planctomycetota bacterium]